MTPNYPHTNLHCDADECKDRLTCCRYLLYLDDENHTERCQYITFDVKPTSKCILYVDDNEHYPPTPNPTEHNT